MNVDIFFSSASLNVIPFIQAMFYVVDGNVFISLNSDQI